MRKDCHDEIFETTTTTTYSTNQPFQERTNKSNVPQSRRDSSSKLCRPWTALGKMSCTVGTSALTCTASSICRLTPTWDGVYCPSSGTLSAVGPLEAWDARENSFLPAQWRPLRRHLAARLYRPCPRRQDAEYPVHRTDLPAFP
jgi:hypothetical protein